MNIPLTIWRAQLRSVHNAGRHDARMQIAIVISLIGSLLLGFWSIQQLQVQLVNWQARGPIRLDQGLWTLCVSTWLGIAVMTAASMPGTLRNDEIILRFTLPVSPATHFRTFYGSFVLKYLGIWPLLQALVCGYVLTTTLGWRALLWWSLLEIGVGMTILCTLVLALYILYYGQRLKRLLLAAGIVIALVISSICYVCWPRLQGGSWLNWIRPEPILLIMLVLLWLALGPGASRFGKVYAARFYWLQGQDRGRSTFTFPGMRFPISLLRRWRNLTAALYVRAFLNQSRNWLFWLRLVLLWGLFCLFPFVRGVGNRYGINDSVLVAGYAIVLAVGHILETGPAVISGEANRLTLYLTAPFSLSHILWSKLRLCLIPVLLEGLLMGSLLAIWQHLSLSQTGWTLLIIASSIFQCTCLLVWSGAWDLDLQGSVEGRIDTMMLEEGPFTPRRMVLLNVSIVFLLAILLLIWWLPTLLALVILILTASIVCWSMYVFSKAQLQRLLRIG
ncbi:hypothetical protein KDA_22460 [Dictyobacter alpinus]|uniref:Uncharacterized protein n=1 Tax=Dictyobacter alpinus TaxID=2014873 RepID=A0A402B5Y4_9CHLR|nr:hypothetical protein [Dictyobacter alpinus]GCE26762.1 hypothetical protein KDA_22460 [Dictyobacter alpinus]